MYDESNTLFTKHSVDEHEYKMHQLVYDSGIINVPKIHSYDKANKIMVMDKILKMNIADEYGEDPSCIPPSLFTLMQDVIRKLYDHCIEFPDITGYNFIFHNDTMFLIDFEHSRVFKDDDDIKDPFVKQFINGLCEWNPEFK